MGRCKTPAPAIRPPPRRRSGRRSKKLEQAVAEARAQHPDTPIEVWATDEHRIGLKPIIRRVWAPKGQRPIALGHPRYKWLYVTAFVQPISGEVFWYVSNGVSKPFFAALLALFAREAGAGRDRIIGGHSVGCQINNATPERVGNTGHAAALRRLRLSGRRRPAVAAARSHRKSPEKPMCSQVSGEVWARSASGTACPCARKCATASAM